MSHKGYRMTKTAIDHLKKAVRDTKDKWGTAQSQRYNANFLNGLQNIADNHHSFTSPHRKALALGTSFSIHLVKHRYVVFQELDNNTIIIVGIFHESMDIPSRLKELQFMAREEIDALKLQNHWL